MDEFAIYGAVPPEWGPKVWMNKPDAIWLRKQLKSIGIQARLLPAPVSSLFIVQALPDLPRPSGEVFCPPEFDDA